MQEAGRGGEDIALLTLSGGLAAAGASAANQYLEAEADAQMERTRHRPLACGRLWRRPAIMLWAVALIAFGAAAALPGRPALALFVLLGAFIYLIVYTGWLKPRTPLNIVVGGAAGSCTVLAGGASVGAWDDPGVLMLAGLVFAWTPTHFWSLALAYREDYRRAGVPMLPALTSAQTAALAASAHGLVAVVLGLALSGRARLGAGYLVPCAVGALGLSWAMLQVVRRPAGPTALALFRASNLYLGSLLLGLGLEALLR